MNILETDILTDFDNITGIDIRQFMSDFLSFVERDEANIVAYYQGDVETANSGSFDRLSTLIDEANDILRAFQLNKEYFENYEYWELLSNIEDIRFKLFTTDNISKFLRSPINKGKFTLGTEANFVLKQNSSIEKTLDINANPENADNEWGEVALYNDLREEDYTNDGGVLLKTIFPDNDRRFIVRAVLDNLQGEKLNGLDIQKKITFENSDLKVLGYIDTMKQSIEILSNLKAGNNPEFPGDGVRESMFIGVNTASFQFPSLFRQLFALFTKDDTCLLYTSPSPRD